MSEINKSKMKKMFLIVVTVFLNLGLFSCTPDAVIQQENVPQACCGEDIIIPPPPPPPPPDGD